jgi:hypothetical protein
MTKLERHVPNVRDGKPVDVGWNGYITARPCVTADGEANAISVSGVSQLGFYRCWQRQ